MAKCNLKKRMSFCYFLRAQFENEIEKEKKKTLIFHF